MTASPWSHESQRRTMLIGAGALHTLDEQMQSLGLDRGLFLASNRASSSGAATLVREMAGKRMVGEFTGIHPRAPIEDVVRAFDVAVSVGADCLLTVGGGSTSDAAKAVALLLGGVPTESLAGMHRPDEFQSVAPIVAVPTTLSGAETTKGGMFYQNGEKRAFGGDGLGARLIVHDPRQLADVPVAVIATTGMNALAHCLEGLICLGANPITDAMALEGTERLARGLVQLTRGDSSTAVVTDLQVGAALGGLCLDTSSVGVHHALCHALGAVYGVAHGVSNSVVLPHALAYNATATRAAQERAAERLAPVLAGLGVSTSAELPTLVSDLQAAVGVPRSLSELHIDRTGFDRVAGQAFEEMVAYGQNPRRPESPDELMTVLELAFA